MAGQESGEREGAPVAPQLLYQPGLEGMRSVLLFLVIFAHTLQFLVPSASIYHISAFGTLTIFYVLTGFLVSAIVMRNLERTGSVQYGTFMKRRIVRITAPMLLFAVVQFTWAVVHGEPLFTPSGGKVLGEVASLAALLTSTLNIVPTFNRDQRWDMVQMWSIGVDMQFFLVWPALWLLIRRYAKSFRAILWVLVGIFVLLQFTRAFEYLFFEGTRLWPADVYQRPENSFDAFIVGVFICVLWKNHRLPVDLMKKLWIPAVLLYAYNVVFVVAWSWVPYFGGYTIACLFSMVIVIEAMRVGSPLYRLFSSTPMRAIGRVSFTAFIWHLWVFIRMNEILTMELWAPVRILVTYAVLAVVTLIAWYIAERPFMRLPPVRHPAPVPT